MNPVTKTKPAPVPGDVVPLSKKLAAAYRGRVGRYKHELGLSTQEAVAKAEEPCSLDRTWAIQDRPPEQVTWQDLQELVGETGSRSLERWEEVKRAAREELQSGHRAGGAVIGRDALPYELARFLAVREELADGWQPRNGVERQLIDQMAQAQYGVFCWQQRLAASGAHGDEAAQAAGAMVDRFSRMFLRTLRALRDLRKVPLAVVVQNAGQVNVGAQQVNVGGRRRHRTPDRALGPC